MTLNKVIFFHVGLERTGTTFLQKNVFPFFQGITYVPKKKFSSAQEIISKSTFDRILVSREFNRSFGKHVADFASKADFPVHPVLILRRHDLWLKSQYKRYLKNGTKVSLDEFFSLDSRKGQLNKDALDYFEKIQFLEHQFKQKPLVVLHDDLLENPKVVIKKVAEFVGAKLDWSKINLNPRHTSYSEHQLKVLYWSYHHLVRGSFRKTKFYRYSILNLANILPKSWFTEMELFPQKHFTKVLEKYASDWDKCIEYVKNQSW